MKFEININEYVYVQLTEKGKQVYYDYYHALDKLGNLNLGELELQEYKEGYVKFQLWQFIQIFGPKIYLGMTEPLFKNNDLQFRGDV
jgi:hypothetical protein